MTPLMDVPTYQLPAMVDSDSLTLPTRSVLFPATGNNFYIPVSPGLSYQARLVESGKGGCYIEVHGGRNVSRIGAWVMSY